MRPPSGRHVRLDSAVRRGRAGVALAVGAVVVVAALAWTWPPQQPPAPPLTATPASPPAAQQPQSSQPPAPDASPADTAPAVAATERWRRTLASLDRRRAEAFSEDRPGLLRSVYSAGSAVLDQDRATLAAYRSRGLRVLDLRMRVLRLRVLDAGPRRAVLVVLERLAAATAVDRSGATTALRSDRPSEHRILLRRTPAGWRIAAVRMSGVRLGER